MSEQEIQTAEGTDEPIEAIEVAEGETATISRGVVGADGATVEPVGSGGKILTWECSIGDFKSHVGEAEVAQHIADVHGDAPAKPRGKRK